MYATNFEGVSGQVTFDANGDRAAAYELWNWRADDSQADGTTLVMVAIFDAGTEVFTMLGGLLPVWAGGEEGSTPPGTLLACLPGFGVEESTGICRACQPGSASPGGDGALCVSCPGGSVASSSANSCDACPAGTYGLGGITCEDCEAGRFTDAVGHSACDGCRIGTYAPGTGYVSCAVCGDNHSAPELWMTMKKVEVMGRMEWGYAEGSSSNESCGCDKGSRQGADGECELCGPELICKGMDDVYIAPGFYSGYDISVWKCHGNALRCTGGLPGDTCAEGRTDITCAECVESMTPGDLGACVECGGSDSAPLIVVVIISVLFMIAAYHVIDTQNRATQTHSLLLCSMAGGQLVTITQQLGVVGMMNVSWQSPISDLLAVAQLFTFDIEILKLNCAGQVDALSRFVAKVLIVFIVSALMLVIHALFVIVRHHGDFRARMSSLIGVTGTVFMVFYISIVTTVLGPLQCPSHPNGKWTTRSYQGVQCWGSGDHTAMVIIGVPVFILAPMTYLCLVTSVVKRFPTKMREMDTGFLKTYGFLFVRFRPEAYWYILLFMGRSLVFAIAPIIPDTFVQVMLLQIVLAAAAIITAIVRPWRVKLMNTLDVFFAVVMLLLVSVSTFFVEEVDNNHFGVAFFGTIVMVITPILLPTAGVYGLYIKFGRAKRKDYQFFICHHKAGAGAFSRLLKMGLVGSGKLKAGVGIDSDNLDNLDKLFDYVGSHTETLVVIASKEIFMRVWCLGEMTKARLHGTNVVVVSVPGYEPPTDSFIDTYEQVVLDLHCLAENGISTQMARETLYWVRDQPKVTVSEPVDQTVMNDLCHKLLYPKDIGNDRNFSRSIYIQPRAKENAKVFILADHENMEAIVSACILQQMMMMAVGSQDEEKVPVVLGPAETCPGTAQTLIILWTNGTLDKLFFIQALTHAAEQRMHVLPVVAEEGFRFPSTAQLASLAALVRDILKEIAVEFKPSSASHSVLVANTDQIVSRLTSCHSVPTLKGI